MAAILGLENHVDGTWREECMSGAATGMVVPVAAPGWVVWWSALGQEHLVDEVDGGVGGLDVAADHAGVAVDREVLAAAADLQGAALEGLVAAGELIWGELAGDHVVGEHGGQQSLGVAKGLVQGGL